MNSPEKKKLKEVNKDFDEYYDKYYVLFRKFLSSDRLNTRERHELFLNLNIASLVLQDLPESEINNFKEYQKNRKNYDIFLGFENFFDKATTIENWNSGYLAMLFSESPEIIGLPRFEGQVAGLTFDLSKLSRKDFDEIAKYNLDFYSFYGLQRQLNKVLDFLAEAIVKQDNDVMKVIIQNVDKEVFVQGRPIKSISDESEMSPELHKELTQKGMEIMPELHQDLTISRKLINELKKLERQPGIGFRDTKTSLDTKVFLSHMLQNYLGFEEESKYALLRNEWDYPSLSEVVSKYYK